MPELNFVSLALLLLAFSGVLAGCLQPHTGNQYPPANYTPRFGLGLNTSSMPLPGRFVENATDINRLASFIWSWGPAALRSCGTNNTRGLQTFMDGQWYLGALNLVFDQCQNYRNQEISEEAKRDEAQGVADQRIPVIIAQQGAILNSTIQSITKLPWPNNTVDLEVLGWVMRRVVWQQAVLPLGIRLAANYTAHHQRNYIEGVYGNLEVPEQEEAVIKSFLAHYPWRPNPCRTTAASVATLRIQAWALLNVTIVKADRLRPKNETVNLSTNFGRLTQDFRPSMQFLDAHGWWPATLWYEAIVTASDGYWDHRYDPVLPSPTEAAYLLAESTHLSRNLIKDDQVERFQETVSFAAPVWSDDPFWASAIAGLPSFRWTYQDLPCAAQTSAQSDHP